MYGKDQIPFKTEGVAQKALPRQKVADSRRADRRTVFFEDALGSDFAASDVAACEGCSVDHDFDCSAFDCKVVRKAVWEMIVSSWRGR
jgi:hypothetical protein